MSGIQRYLANRTIAAVDIPASCTSSLAMQNAHLSGFKWACGKSVSLSTARRELETLQAAKNRWHTESPPAAVPKIVKPDRPPSRQRYLTRDEAARMLRAARALKMNIASRL
jgi:hypothetical protein